MQQVTAAEPKAGTSSLFALTPYLTVWAGLALVAASYIAIAIAQPDMLRGDDGVDVVIPPQAQNSSARPTQTAEQRRLEQKLAEMERDMQTSSITTSSLEHERQSHLDRIAALEAKAAKAEQSVTAQPDVQSSGFPSTSLPIQRNQQHAASEIAERIGGATVLNAPASQDAATTAATEVAKTAAKQKAQTAVTNVVEKSVTAAAKPLAGDGLAADIATKAATQTVTNAATQQTNNAVDAAAAKTQQVATAAVPEPMPRPQAPKPTSKPQLKTGSIDKAATPAIAFGPATVTPAARPIGVRLATAPSIDSLRLSWNALRDRHGPLLQQLQPRYTSGLDATGMTYDLIAGPFQSQSDATEVCARLHSNGTRCALGEFSGNAL